MKHPSLIFLALAVAMGGLLLCVSCHDEEQVFVDMEGAREKGVQLPATNGPGMEGGMEGGSEGQETDKPVAADPGKIEPLLGTDDLVAEVGGRITDELSMPLAGMRVQVSRSDDVQWMGLDAPVLAEAVSDSEGGFEIKGLPLGSFVLRVMGEGWARMGQELFLRGGQPKQLGLTLRMRRGQKLSGVVVDESGAPVVGAWIVARWTRIRGGEIAWPEVRSDAEGKFSFSGLPVALVHVLAWSEGRTLGLEEWTVGQSGQLRLVLPPAGPYGFAFKLAEPTNEDGPRPTDLEVMIRYVAENRTLPLPGPIGRMRMPMVGEFRSQGLRAGSYRIALRSQEVALTNDWAERSLTQENPLSTLAVAWSPLTLLTGRLLLSHATPAQGVLLQIWTRLGPTRDIARTDKEGRFIFSRSFQAGEFPFVSIETPGFLFRRGNANSTSTTIRVGAEESDYRLRSSLVFAGHVIDKDSKPVPYAEVWLSPGDSAGRQQGVTVTDASGAFRISRRISRRMGSWAARVGRWPVNDEFSIPAMANRSLFLQAERDALICRSPLAVGGRGRKSSSGLVLQLVEGGIIEGRVVDEKGVGIAGATVLATLPPRAGTKTDETGEPMPLPTVQRFAFCDPDGRFRIRGLHGGRWELGATSPGRYRRDAMPVVAIQPGERKQGLELVLPKGLVIEGRLVSQGGRPMGGARIEAMAPDEPPAEAEWSIGSTRTAADGSFVLRGLRECEYQLQARLGRHLQDELGLLLPSSAGRPAMRSRRPYETRMTPQSSEESASAKGSLATGRHENRWQIKIAEFGGFRLELPTLGAPLQRVALEFAREDESWHFDVKVVDGLLSLERLIAGTYELTIRSPRFEDLHRKVQIQHGEVTKVEILEVVPSARRAWRVVDAQGNGLEGVWIGLDPKLEGLWQRYGSSPGWGPFEGRVLTESDAEGRFQIPRRVPRAIYAFKPGYKPRSHPGDFGLLKDLILERAGELQVQPPPPPENRSCLWYVRLTRIDGRKRRHRRNSDYGTRLHASHPTRFLGLKPGRYSLEAADFMRVWRYSEESIPGRTYYEEIQIGLGDNGLIRFR